MGSMAVARIIILSALFAQTLSAPTLSDCTELCNTYHASSSGGYHDHAALIQSSSGAGLSDRDYARPGNWTERNHYRTDDGHGKVHEERGQYADNSKKVRYYRKNFTSSYGTASNVVNGEDAAVLSRQTSDRGVYDGAYDRARATSVTRESGYNRMHGQQTQSSSTSIDSRSERLEDFFDDYSQVQQRPTPGGDNAAYPAATAPANWSRVDSYKTDGGHGQVYEEEGQYVTGPKQVRYYKQNYTSSYSTSGALPTQTGGVGSPELTHLQQNIHKQLDDIRREIHHASSASLSALAAGSQSTQRLTQEKTAGGFRSDDLQTAESDAHGLYESSHRRVPTSSSGVVQHHYVDQQQRLETTYGDSARQHAYTPSSYTPSYTSPSSSYPSAVVPSYGTESQRTYQNRQTYVSRVHPATQPAIHSSSSSVGYVQQVPVTGEGHHYSTSSHRTNIDESRRVHSDVRHDQQALYTGEDTRRSSYHPPTSNYVVRPGGRDQTTSYEEHWSSASSRTGNGLATPERGAAHYHGHDTGRTSHYDRDAYNEQLAHRHRTSAQGYDSHARSHSESGGFDSAYRTTAGQLVTGSLDLGQAAQSAVDCTEETQEYQRQESRYHRKYKRDDRYAQQRRRTAQHEDFGQESQRSEEFGQRTVGDQHLEDLMQQTEGQLEFGQQTVGNQHEDLTQQMEGQFELGQQTIGNQHEDLTQQTEDQFELGQQTIGNQHEDLTQQTEGQFELGQQTIGNQHEDLTQQTEGQFELGQQTVGNQHSEDLTQQTEGQFELRQQTVGNQHEDLTQQTEGQFELGQQTIDNQHEDLTQQTEGQFELGQQTVGDQHSEDLTQQTEDQFELGQQTIGNKDLEDLTQEREEQSTQQTEGKLEFGQQTVGNQDSEDLTQQKEGQFEFGQQAVGDQHLDNLTQQTEDQFSEFGQQTVDRQHFEDLTQQTEQFEQQAGGVDEFAQQTSGKIKFAQQTDDDQQQEDLTQQTEQQQRIVRSDDLTQQTVGGLEFDQHGKTIEKFIEKPKSQRLEEFDQENEDFVARQTAQRADDDFTQQTMGHIEFGKMRTQQQSHRSNGARIENQHLDLTQQRNEDLTQQVGGFDDLAQHTTGHLEYGRQREQQTGRPNQPGHNTRRLEQFSQQDGWDREEGLSQQSSYQYPPYDTDSNNERSQWRPLEQMSQRTQAFDRDSVQRSSTDQQPIADLPKPAPKPKPRRRYQQYEHVPPHADDGTRTNSDNAFRSVEVNPVADSDDGGTGGERSGHSLTHPKPDRRGSQPIESQEIHANSGFDSEKENMDRLHWVHKSNDATVGLQWHYAYHPSDLTNVEGSHTSYPRYNVDSTSRPTDKTEKDDQTAQQPWSFDHDQREAREQRQRTLEDQQQQTQRNDRRLYGWSWHSTTETSRFDDQSQFDQNSESAPSRVVPLQHDRDSQQMPGIDREQSTTQTSRPGGGLKMEPRILQAFGGPYEASRGDEEIYRRVTPNPRATLPPVYHGEDPWDIREKPREVLWPVAGVPRARDAITTEKAETEEIATITEITTTTAPPSFWARLGHKITNTYGKAKEKAKEIFG